MPFPGLWKSRLGVHLASAPYLHIQNNKLAIPDLIDDAVIPNP